ncbi:MAG TPA: ABC transporter permease [Anaerolineales bacterium]|nr:ABC transporter permease [Anaerolineales bacterium]
MNLQLTLALRYLGGRKLRTFLTTLAIVFGVMLIFGMNTIMPAFLAAFTTNIMAAASQVDATITNKTGQSFPESVAEQVAAVEGVTHVSATLERPINLPVDYFDGDAAIPDRISSVTLVGVSPDQYRAMTSVNVVEGRYLEAGDGANAVIADSLAEAGDLKLGDTIPLPPPTGTVDLPIIGITPPRLLPGNEEILVTLTEAQTMLDTPGVVNVIEANFDSVEETRRAEIETAIVDKLGSAYTIGVLQAGAEILQNIGVAQSIFNLLGGLGLLMGGFIIFNTFRTIIAERRRDIGMLRAVGASRSTITWLILMEGVIQGVIGTAIGILIGYGFGAVALNSVGAIGQQFLNVQIGNPTASPGLFIVSILMGVGITVLAGVIPARAASRITPLEALRPSVAQISIKRMAGVGFWSGVVMIAIAVGALISGNGGLISLGAVLFTAGLIMIAPALVNPIANLFGALMATLFARQGTAQLAEGNLSRQPSRAAITASTTMIALAILIMAGSVLSSVSLTFTNMLKNSLSSDYLLLPPSVSLWGSDVGASPQLAEDLRKVEGVEVVSSLRFATTNINDVAVGLLGIEPEAYNQTSGLTFVDGDAETAFAAMEAGRGMIMNGILATGAGVKLGDEVTLLTPTGEQMYKVVGIASDYLNAKTTTGYISQANMAADFNHTEDVFIQLNVKEGADIASVEAGIKHAMEQFPQFKLVSGQEYLDQNIGLFDAMFAGFYAMLVFLAIPSLIAMINTLAIGVIERTREIGMLRAVGSTRKQIRMIILTEALILAAIGTAFGLLSGLYLGVMAVKSFEALGFPVEYIFPASSLVAATAGGLIFGVLAAIVPARQAAKMDVVAALRFE